MFCRVSEIGCDKLKNKRAGVAKLADAADLGSVVARRGGSSPLARTNDFRPPINASRERGFTLTGILALAPQGKTLLLMGFHG